MVSKTKTQRSPRIRLNPVKVIGTMGNVPPTNAITVAHMQSATAISARITVTV